jgi:hypothetical protein
MNDLTTFEFYSDTNISNAYDELQLMALDELVKDGNTLTITTQDMNAMGESILAIVKYNGGELVE